MSDQSPNLFLPFILPSQAQKHVTHNEALRRLDAVVQLTVISHGQNEPPELSDEGDRHIVGSGAVGLWAGHSGELAVHFEGNWEFLVPRPGWRAHILPEGRDLLYDGSAWITIPPDLTEDALQNLPLAGINGSADSMNRLTVSAPATLFSHDGAGHQLKLNKATSEDTASVLFQSDWSGRAEMGLAGNDDFSFKVSPDGSLWTTAMTVSAYDGRVEFPGGGVRQCVEMQTTWYVDPVSGNDANDGLSPGVGAFETIGHALNMLTGMDGNSTIARIQLADGTYNLPVSLVIDKPLVGFIDLEIIGNAGDPSQVALVGSTGDLFWLRRGHLTLRHITLDNTGTGSILKQDAGTRLAFENLVFGGSNRFHIENDGGFLEMQGGYAITGSAQIHLRCGGLAYVKGANFGFNLSGNPNFSQSFVLAMENSVINWWNASVSGSATGMRYLAVRGGIINTYGKGTSFLPGDTAGSVGTQGQYL